jgi:ABC-2 type transport system permease protein
MTGALHILSGISPLGAAVEAIQDSVQGQFPPAMPLLVLVAYAVVFGFLAQRWFRWE